MIKASPLHISGVYHGGFSEHGDEYDPRIHGKSTLVPRNLVSDETKAALKAIERVYADVVSPMKEESVGKAKYFVILLNEYSGYSMVRFIFRKNETAKAVIQMIREIETIFNSKVQTLACMYKAQLCGRDSF